MQAIERGTEAEALVDMSRAKRNLNSATLYEEAIRNAEGKVAATGPLVVSTGQYTGRSPKDKFVVKEPTSQDKIWWGSVNQPLEEEQFNALRDHMQVYMQTKDLYSQDLFVGADPETSWLEGCGVARDPQGFILTGRACGPFAPTGSPAPLASNVPGVFAVGDVRSGSVKRVGGAIGEGASVVALIHQYLAGTR